MRKFTWSLQRILDIRCKQEDALKVELMNLNRQINDIEQEIASRKQKRATLLRDFGTTEPAQRITRQQSMLQIVSVTDELIRSLAHKRQEMETKKQERIGLLVQLRKSIKTLETLKHKAYEEFQYRANAAENNMLDEVSAIATARSLCGIGDALI